MCAPQERVPTPRELAETEDLTPPPLLSLLSSLRPWAIHLPRVAMGVPMSRLVSAARLGPEQVGDAVTRPHSCLM